MYYRGRRVAVTPSRRCLPHVGGQGGHFARVACPSCFLLAASSSAEQNVLLFSEKTTWPCTAFSIPRSRSSAVGGPAVPGKVQHHRRHGVSGVGRRTTSRKPGGVSPPPPSAYFLSVFRKHARRAQLEQPVLLLYPSSMGRSE